MLTNMLKGSQIVTLAMALMLFASPSSFANPGAEAALVRSMETGLAASRGEAGALGALERASIETRALRVLAENQGLSAKARVVFAGAKTLAAVDVTALDSGEMAIAQQILANPATYSRTAPTVVTTAMTGTIDGLVAARRKDGVMGARSPRAGTGTVEAKDTMVDAGVVKDVVPSEGGRPVKTREMTEADRTVADLLARAETKQAMAKVETSQRPKMIEAIQVYVEGVMNGTLALSAAQAAATDMMVIEGGIPGAFFDVGALSCLKTFDSEAQATFTAMNAAVSAGIRAGTINTGQDALAVMANTMASLLGISVEEARVRLCQLASDPCKLYALSSEACAVVTAGN